MLSQLLQIFAWFLWNAPLTFFPLFYKNQRNLVHKDLHTPQIELRECMCATVDKPYEPRGNEK